MPAKMQMCFTNRKVTTVNVQTQNNNNLVLTGSNNRALFFSGNKANFMNIINLKKGGCSACGDR